MLLPPQHRRRLQRWLTRDTGVQWCRVVMNREIEKFVRSLDCHNADALEVSGTGSQGTYDFRTYESTQYPEYDVCAGPLREDAFDLVIAEQVLEHVVRPDLAVMSVYKMLRPGGTFVVSTPFLLKIHGHPFDLYRWTEHGMRQLLETAGFDVMGTGSWGNRECLLADLADGLTWTIYDPDAHSLRNESQFPIVVWAFARKAQV